jgi:hypothetical protein
MHNGEQNIFLMASPLHSHFTSLDTYEQQAVVRINAGVYFLTFSDLVTNVGDVGLGILLRIATEPRKDSHGVRPDTKIISLSII